MRPIEREGLFYGKSWRLQSARAEVSGSGRVLPHSVSRHKHVRGEGLIHPDSGREFAQGTLFPTHVKSGDITRIEAYVAKQFIRWKNGRKSSVVRAELEDSGAIRLRVRIRRYGIKDVGVFIKQGQVATVYPEHAIGNNYLSLKGLKIRKSRRDQA